MTQEKKDLHMRNYIDNDDVSSRKYVCTEPDGRGEHHNSDVPGADELDADDLDDDGLDNDGPDADDLDEDELNGDELNGDELDGDELDEDELDEDGLEDAKTGAGNHPLGTNSKNKTIQSEYINTTASTKDEEAIKSGEIKSDGDQIFRQFRETNRYKKIKRFDTNIKTIDRSKIKKQLLQVLNKINDRQLINIAENLFFGIDIAIELRRSWGASLMKDALSDAISKKHNSIESARSELDSIILNANKYHLKEDEWFSWFSGDPRATIWLWELLFNSHPAFLYIVNITRNELNDYLFNSPSIPIFDSEPNSSNGRLDQIYEAFDGLMIIVNNRIYKKILIKQLRKEWQLRWNKTIKRRAWEKNGPKEAATWAFELMLDLDTSEFSPLLIQRDSSQGGNRTAKVRDLNLHLNPINDDEALLAYYALAWQLYAHNPIATKKLLDKCAIACNQMVRRHKESAAKQLAKSKGWKEAKLSSSPSTRLKAGSAKKSEKSNEAISTATVGLLGEGDLAVYSVHSKPKLIFSIGKKNARLSQLLLDADVTSAFFVLAEWIDSKGGHSVSKDAFSEEISNIVAKYNGALVAASVNSLDGTWPEKNGYFVLGGGEQCAKEVLDLLHASEYVWCEQGQPPIMTRRFK